MAITVHAQPQVHTLADGRNFFLISTNDQFVNNGARHVSNIVFFGGIPLNLAEMAFTYGAGTVLMPFQFTTVPNNSGYQLPTGFGSLQIWIDTVLLPSLQRNLLLMRDYEVVSITDGISLTARQVGAFYQVVPTFFSPGISHNVITLGANDVEKENFSIAALVEVQPGINLTAQANIHELSIYTYKNQVHVHVNKVLLAYWNRNARPDYNQAANKDVSSAVIAYRVRFTEVFGDPPMPQRLNELGVRYSLPGGESKRSVAEDMFLNHLNFKRFLTHSRYFNALAGVPLVLNYFHLAADPFSVGFTITKKDGNTVSNNLGVYASPVMRTLLCLNISVDRVAQVAGVDVDDIASYTVFIADLNNIGVYFSEFFTVYVDDTSPKDVTTLLFQNSFGVYEYIHLRGTHEVKMGNEVSAVNLMKNAPAASLPVTEILQASTMNMHSVATGFLTRDEANHMRELMGSKDVYWLDGRFVPVIIEDGDNALYDTDSGTLNGFTVKFSEEQKESYI
jgi:hypothetical protein